MGSGKGAVKDGEVRGTAVHWWWVGGLLLVAVIVVAAAMPTPSQQKEKERHAEAVGAWSAKVKAKLAETCKKSVEATGLFHEEFREAFGKGFKTRAEPRDLVAWNCPNGVRYWSTSGAVPPGFVRDYHDVLPQHPSGK